MTYAVQDALQKAVEVSKECELQNIESKLNLSYGFKNWINIMLSSNKAYV